MDQKATFDMTQFLAFCGFLWRELLFGTVQLVQCQEEAISSEYHFVPMELFVHRLRGISPGAWGIIGFRCDNGCVFDFTIEGRKVKA